MRRSYRPGPCLEELERRDAPGSLLLLSGSVSGTLSGLRFVLRGDLTNVGAVSGAPVHIPLGLSQGISVGTNTTSIGDLTRVSYYHGFPTPFPGLIPILEFVLFTGGTGQLAGASGAEVNVGLLDLFSKTATFQEWGLLRTPG